MYKNSDYWDAEDICFEYEHIEKVLEVIKANFDDYFERFILSNAGNTLTEEDFKKLQQKFGIGAVKNNTTKNKAQNYKSIIIDAIEAFEKDREDYKKIFDIDLLEELEDDADVFKSKILKNECPVIRKTLANRRAKELDKYRASFNMADADELLSVITNLCKFADEYYSRYDADLYENFNIYDDLEMFTLDTHDYTYYGVIGGGIKTHMLFKIYPAVFSNRSRSALWALWYLTDKKTFDCETDSEFVMIDTEKAIMQQNYFYPYGLFSYYALEIYKLLREKANDYGVFIDPEYKYVIVDAFLEYVALEHDEEISFLKSQIRDGGMGFA